MAEFTEGAHTGEFLMSEAGGSRSWELGFIAASQTLVVGQLLGLVSVGALSATAVAKAGNTGNGVMGAITVAAGTPEGAYVLSIVEPASNAGAFIIENPDGVAIGNGDVAAAFSGGGLGFTLADGATDFAAGDQFTITVVAADATAEGQYKALNLAATDGSQDVAAIAYRDITTGVGETVTEALLVRDCEVNGNLIVYPAGATTDEKAAIRTALEGKGIIVR